MIPKNLSTPLSQDQIGKINELIDCVSSKQRKDFGKISSDIKPDGTLITNCDRWSDKTIVQGLSEITQNEGVLSEEGNQSVPNTSAYWIVDPLDGTTNFAAGIPYWGISIARFVEGKPETTFLDVPPLKQRIIARKGRGVWLNGKPITSEMRSLANSACISLCSRSIRVLQRKPNTPFPGKIRLLGVASLNMTSVAIGQTIAALEATPKIWDLASAWLVLSELNCPIRWLENEPSNLLAGEDLSQKSFPVLTASTEKELQKILPWAEILIKN